MEDGTPIASGAEGSVYDTEFLGRKAVAKVRAPKGYRIPELDASIRSRRTRTEARILREARKAGVRTPLVYMVDLEKGEIVMERAEGPTVKSVIDSDPESAEGICAEIGRQMAVLHNARISHGDPTTSNIIVADGGLVFIDFSMGQFPADDEAVGADMCLLERAFSSAHPGSEKLYKALMDEYMRASSDGEAVMRKVREIRARARYT